MQIKTSVNPKIILTVSFSYLTIIKDHIKQKMYDLEYAGDSLQIRVMCEWLWGTDEFFKNVHLHFYR